MEASRVLLLCIVLTCSVWTVQAGNMKVNTDDQEEVEVSVDAGKLPGVCWVCKWALNKIKKVIGPNATAESVTMKLKAVCNECGLLKSLCHKFVKTHLGPLVEELTTTDDVRSICVNTRACKPKDLEQLFYQSEEEPGMEMNEYA